MSQRTALEQDVIDFAKSTEEIFEKQSQLQRDLVEIYMILISRLLGLEPSYQELELNSFGVNPKPRVLYEGVVRNHHMEPYSPLDR